MSVELLLLLQNLCNAAQGLFAVDNAGGIDRVVDDDRLGPCVHLPGKVLQVRLEAGQLRIHLYNLSMKVACIAAVFAKIGPEHHHIVVNIQNCFEDNVNGAGSPHGHDHILLGKPQAKLPIQMVRHSLPYLRIPGIIGIAVKGQGVLVLNDFNQRVVKGLGHRGHRVAQGKIKNILRANLLRQLLPFNKHLSNGRGIIKIIKHLF